MRGTIASIKFDRGFFFIRPQERGVADVFGHHRSLQNRNFDTLEPGLTVEYDIAADPKGRRAAANVFVR
jgi:cold shock CspA family protein